MSVRFLNPHNVTHGSNAIAKCREASIRARFSEVKHLFGDGSAFAKRAAGFRPGCELSLVTEDVARALSTAPGTTATLSFNVADAEGGADKTVTAANAVYLGPAEDLGGALRPERRHHVVRRLVLERRQPDQHRVERPQESCWSLGC